MKKRMICMLLAIVMTVAMFSVAVPIAQAETTLSKDANGSYLIQNESDLFAFAALVNGGVYDACAKLTADITMTGQSKPWTPIAPSSMIAEAYTGDFDGQGHTISNLYCNDTTTNYGGLFGFIYGGSVKNVTIANSSITGMFAGAIVASTYIGSSIEGCANLNTTVSGGNVGGIVGDAHTTSILACQNTGTITGDGWVGGICGFATAGSVRSCWNIGTVTSTGRFAGGVLGGASSNSTEVSYCYNEGFVTSDYYFPGRDSEGSIVGGSNSNYHPKMSNCCYLFIYNGAIWAYGGESDHHFDNIEEVRSSVLAGGKVTHLLNQGLADTDYQFYQNLDNNATPDAAPTSDRTHGTVYGGYLPCSAELKYSNSYLSPTVCHDNVSFVAEGVTIRESCATENCPVATQNLGSVTLKTANTYYYTGNPVAAQTEGAFLNGATHEITYNGAATAPGEVGTHTATLSACVNGIAKQSVTGNYTISYLPAPDYTVGGAAYFDGNDYWYRSGEPAVVMAPDGYLISTQMDGAYDSAVRLAQGDQKVVFFKREADGAITQGVDLSAKLRYDTSAPVGKIALNEQTYWQSLLNKITFGLFFKTAQSVTITAEDSESGMAAIQYYVADGDVMSEQGPAALETLRWVDYNGAISLQNNAKNVVYAKLTDHVGNVTYLSSDGVVLDGTAPVIHGIENGGTYYGDTVFQVTDDYLLKIELDGKDITNTADGDKYTIVADNAPHIVTATDKAGNVTECEITVYKRYMVTFTAEGEGSYEKEFKYGEVITIPTNEIFKDTFRKAGYTLIGWQGYTEGMTMPLENLTFVAEYSANTYTVSFNTNGGPAVDPMAVVFGEKYGNLPASPITGISAATWYLVDNNGLVTDTKITKLVKVSTARDHTLYAKRNILNPSVSIALTVPGGISDKYQYYIPGASQRVLTATVKNANPQLLDYTYQWYKDGAPIDGATANVLMLEGNVSDSGTYRVEVRATLKDGTGIEVAATSVSAVMEQKVTILHASNTLRYDANGGEGGPQSGYTGGATIKVSKAEPVRAHYDFIGWNTKADGSGQPYNAEDEYTFTEDGGNGGCVVTLYATWQLKKYPVTFRIDGAIASTETVEHGSDVRLPEIPAKKGFAHKWDSDGKNITGETTITAVYTLIPVVNPEELSSGDKTALESARNELETALENNVGNYTDEQKSALREEIGRITDALSAIDQALAVDDMVAALPDHLIPGSKADENKVKEANAAYEALSDRAQGLLRSETKEKLQALTKQLHTDCDGTNLCPSLRFEDLKTSAWYHHSVDFVIANGYMCGDPDGAFRPEEALTRGEMAQILYNLAGRPRVNGADTFADTLDGAWYTKAILWCAQNGLIVGYGNGKFGPDDILTREQMITVLYRYDLYSGGAEFQGNTTLHYSDASKVSVWARTAMAWADAGDIINGKPGNLLNPTGFATRAQTATVLYKYNGI